MLLDNILDTWATVDAKRILDKPKLHIISHLPEDVHRKGPAHLYSTETFKGFNGVFRLCSVLSNHIAPSRDIALACMGMERFKHQVSGGYWKQDGAWVSAGSLVRSFFSNNAALRRRLGWAATLDNVRGKLMRFLIQSYL